MIYLKEILIGENGYEIEDGVFSLFNKDGHFVALRAFYFGDVQLKGEKYAPLYMKENKLYAVDDVSAEKIEGGYINLTLEISKSNFDEVGYLLFFPILTFAKERPITDGKLLFSRYPNEESIVLLKENQSVKISDGKKEYEFKVENGKLVETPTI